MANVTILQLPQANGLTGTEQIEGVQAGTSVRIPLSALAALAPGPPGPVGPTGPAGAPFAIVTPAEQAAAVNPASLNPASYFLYQENDIRRYSATFGTNDNATWDNCRAVATQNGRPMSLAGLTLKFLTGVNYDYVAHRIQDGTLDFTSLTSGPALTYVTTGLYTEGYVFGLTNVVLLGPGRNSSVDAVQFGATSGGTFGAFANFSNVFITSFRYGLTWSKESWLQSIGDVFIQACLWGVYYPPGLSVSGENVGFSHLTISLCTNGIYCAGGYLNLEHVSIDYCTNKAIWCQVGGVVRASHFHIESNLDNDYWIECDDSESEVCLEAGTFAYTGSSKTAFAVGNCTNVGSAQINVGNVEFVGFTEANYGFNYFFNGHGTCRNVGWQVGGTGAGLPAAVPFTGTNLLVDGGFAGTAIFDWGSFGNGCQAVLSTAQHFAGTKSMSQAPTSSQTASEQLYFVCQPGVNVQFACRLIKDGTISTDVATIGFQFFDENKNAIGLNAATRTISSLPTTWTRYVSAPFGQAPPGARYCSVTLGRAASGGGVSDGNGTIYWDDCYLSVTGGMGRMMAVGEILTITQFNLATAGSRTLFKGYAIDGLYIQNTTANAVTGGIKIGSTAGNTDVVTTIAVGANADIYVPASALSKSYLSSTGRQTYFVDAVGAWNGANLNISWHTKKVITQGY